MTTTRRDFIKGSGTLVVTFSLAGAVRPAHAQGGGKPVALDEVDTFLTISADGSVTVYTGKVDLGTGTRTSLRQMAAEELDVALDRVKLIEGDTASTPDQGPTWGSLSIQIGGVQIRQAAATARRALVEAASQKLGIPAADLETRNGVVSVARGAAASVGYGELIGDKQFRLKVDKAVPLKDPAKYTVVGKSIPRVDVPAKCTGEFTYMQDVRVPGMVHARVVRPPAIGATLVSVDEKSVAGIKGLVKMVRAQNFLAVVAESEWAAVKAADRLKATWSPWSELPEMTSLYDHVRKTPVNKDEVTLNRGDAKGALGGAAKTLSATYDFAIHTHGSIGPSCAVAEYRKDGTLTVWTASQATHWLRRDLAATFGIPVEKIRCLYADGAGCYGRNGHEDAAADAVLLSRELGRPVRVQWMRHDEHGWDPKGPPTLVELRGGLDASGNVVAWQSEFWIPKAIITSQPPMLAATLAGLPKKDDINPGNIFQNSAIPYAIANVHAVCHRLESTVFRPSWIRTPGRMQNTYANEAFMDELAAAAQVDPIQFRLRYLQDPRGVEVLKAAAEKARWITRPSPKVVDPANPVATGRGVTYVKYENVRTYVAAVAEVEVDRATGDVRCTRVVVAHDCGLMINPDGVRQQIEGNVIQTVSRTLKEELKWNRSRVTSVDWRSYPILKFPDVPEVDIVLLDRPKEPPWGAGEPAAAVVPSAISNAVFDAIGVRLRSVPYTAEKVKKAISAKA
jgi:CO/xanthine dehydrogenase Mo-binding subunit